MRSHRHVFRGVDAAMIGWVLALAGAVRMILPSGAIAETAINGFVLDGATIPREEIHHGGPPRDGIPSIDKPLFDSVQDVDGLLRADDLVLGIERNGVARAYPVQILNFHEVVNDNVGGEGLVVTFCPLCGTGMVFKRKLAGRTLEFGVSGLLYQSDVLLYDRETESLWSQIARRAVSGPLVGQTLELVPSQMLRWKQWKQRHPEGQVLSRRTGFQRPYDRSPYAGYEKRPDTMFPVAQHRKELEPKEWVFGVIVAGWPKAYRASALPDRSPLLDTVGNTPIELHYERDSLAFRALDKRSGKELPHTRSFWFAWQAFYPETELFLGETEVEP